MEKEFKIKYCGKEGTIESPCECEIIEVNKEFKLDEKMGIRIIRTFHNPNYKEPVIPVSDIKQFIKIILEEISPSDVRFKENCPHCKAVKHILDLIKKRAGEKLC